MTRGVVVLLFLSVVGSVFAGQCNPLPFTNETISGLTFCSNMNGKSVDSFFQSAWVNVATGKTWPQYVDSILEDAWSKITSYVSTAATNNGFTVCDSCLQNMKELMCAGAFPIAGYYNCIYSAMMDFYSSACPEMCLCNSNYCCFSGPSSDPACADPANRNPSYAPGQVSQTCLSNLQKGDFLALFSSCAANHLPERAACQKMVSTCACVSETDQMAISACQLYSVNGYPFQLSDGTCSSTSGWCGTASSGQGSIKINSALSLNAPTPVASEAYSASSAGVTQSQTGPNVGVVPTSHSSNAAALQVSAAIALAAAGAALMA